MIVYDNNCKIVGMSDKVLEILEFQNVDEFLNTHNDIDEMQENFIKNSNALPLVRDILNCAGKSRILNLNTKNGNSLSVLAKAETINLPQKKEAFKLEILVQNSPIDRNFLNLRLPLLQNLNNQSSQEMRVSSLNDQWFKQTCKFLNLSQDDFLSYLTLLVKNINQNMPSLQNAVIAQDELKITNIINLLKEPTINLRVTPLVKIYEAIQKTQSTEIGGYIISISECLDSLGKLIDKNQRKA
ncbi:hypothetical protein KDE13_04250 [Campylobacter sp. faydin G-140]|uniref:hypothetical protein n=1 Tax=Campylobacter anatolicus TaxID=2829105 RepID=UPI001B9B36B6|nr:hypothetical protein [Campylobacter anatolicus]MBR8465572.1 hypothetical protein [Campylobacter anatolicus]